MKKSKFTWSFLPSRILSYVKIVKGERRKASLRGIACDYGKILLCRVGFRKKKAKFVVGYKNS